MNIEHLKIKAEIIQRLLTDKKKSFEIRINRARVSFDADWKHSPVHLEITPRGGFFIFRVLSWKQEGSRVDKRRRSQRGALMKIWIKIISNFGHSLIQISLSSWSPGIFFNFSNIQKKMAEEPWIFPWKRTTSPRNNRCKLRALHPHAPASRIFA